MSVDRANGDPGVTGEQPKPARKKGPHRFRLARVCNDSTLTNALVDVREGDVLMVDMGRAFPSTAAVRGAVAKEAKAGEFCAVLIRDRFAVSVETPEPVPVVTVKSVKV